jgi:2-oxo-3-hexenedioate decarboxylase
VTGSLESARLAEDLRAAYAARRIVPSPTARNPTFTLDEGYGVESELRRLRLAEGRSVVGVKVGFANRAVWRALRLETLVWAAMYDDTVRYAMGGHAALSVTRMTSPKIEPEIVMKLARPVDGSDAAAALASVEWIALGFELIDCVFPDWKFQPADFVASYGLHSALVVGEPARLTADLIPGLVGELSQFGVKLSRNGEIVEEGGGRNVLKSPALCLAELAGAIARRPGAEPLGAGRLVSTGTLTTSQPCAVGERWSAAVEGLGVDALSLTLTA